ncbi:MAG: polymerase sigma-70 factor [Mucilaginibacter sp.]|nr:polymerase sigma-70 factor [Mucilaginibacter sp.]
MPLSSLSDADLWSLIVNDNYRAFTVLFQRYWLKLYKTAQKYIKDDQACEESVHDLFLNIWNRRNYLIINNFDHYLKASIRYQVYAHLKKAKLSLISYQENLHKDGLSFTVNNGYEKILYSELEEQLNEQLNALPDRCREIFLLSRKNHLTNTEISEKLSISKRTVENQITIALKHLRLYFKHIASFALLFYLNR